MKHTIWSVLAFVSALVALLLSVDIQLWGNTDPWVAAYVATASTIFSLIVLIFSPILRWLSVISFLGALFLAWLGFLAAAGGM